MRSSEVAEAQQPEAYAFALTREDGQWFDADAGVWSPSLTPGCVQTWTDAEWDSRDCRGYPDKLEVGLRVVSLALTVEELAEHVGDAEAAGPMVAPGGDL